ncbi:MAG: EF-P beta-lysylation protein EpmB [Flavobacteriales bacterium]|jgi:EF-P beta-lysylation protein EpmB
MIQRSIESLQVLSWQEELASLIKDPETLFKRLNLDESRLPEAIEAHKLFPVRTTESFLRRIKHGDIHDPLLRQILPLGAELNTPDNYSKDPLAEELYNPSPGIVHKYQGRVLLIASGQCAINCRYCFRREFDYGGNKLDKAAWRQSLDYIQDRSDINEVILSGGDPLSLSDKALKQHIHDIEKIPHIKRLRIHTRMPVVLPSRISPDLLSALESTRLHCIVVIHCNHPQEVDEELSQSLIKLKNSCKAVLNQAVLLAGVNDSASTLYKLSERLFECGVLPYYLHTLDKVAGAAHFDVSDKRAASLIDELRDQAPGYLVPKLVREIAGKNAKTPLY